MSNNTYQTALSEMDAEIANAFAQLRKEHIVEKRLIDWLPLSHFLTILSKVYQLSHKVDDHDRVLWRKLVVLEFENPVKLENTLAVLNTSVAKALPTTSALEEHVRATFATPRTDPQFQVSVFQQNVYIIYLWINSHFSIRSTLVSDGLEPNSDKIGHADWTAIANILAIAGQHNQPNTGLAFVWSNICSFFAAIANFFRFCIGMESDRLLTPGEIAALFEAPSADADAGAEFAGAAGGAWCFGNENVTG